MVGAVSSFLVFNAFNFFSCSSLRFVAACLCKPMLGFRRISEICLVGRFWFFVVGWGDLLPVQQGEGCVFLKHKHLFVMACPGTRS